MQLTTLLSTLLAIIPFTLAAPPPYGYNITTNTTGGAPVGDYYLVTSVIGGGDKGKDHLYVTGDHTGAGTSDVTLEGIDVASKGYFFNNTNQLFDFDTSFPWGFVMGSPDNYGAWESVMLDSSMKYDSGFYFDGNKLLWNETEYGFLGWLACDWYHGVPQLFWITDIGAANATLPCSCAKVDLLAVPV